MAWIKLNATTPAPPEGARNVHFRQDPGHSGTQADPIPVSAYYPLLGGVNPQTGTSYTVLAADQGKLVTLSNASPVAVSLDSALDDNFFCAVENLGAGTATLTPSSGTINGAANLAVATGSGAIIFFDGTNWEAVTAGGGGGGVSSVGLSAEASWFTVDGSPVTSSGTLELNLTDALAANQVLATPDNATGKVGPRALVGRDLPIGLRADVVLDAGVIAAGAGATGSFALGKSSLLYQIVAAYKCRLRLYSTAASRDDGGEVAREWGVLPGQNIDLLLDITWGGAAPQTYPINPKAVLHNKDGTVATAIYYNVTSREIVSQHFTFTLTRLLLES